MKRLPRAERLALSLMAGTSLCLSGPAGAQTADQEDPSSEQVAGNVIIVTSQKRAEDLLDVPISVAALTGEDLAERNLRTLEDISLVTPGLNFDLSSQFGSPVVSIRGIASLTGSSTTGYYLDEMPLLQRDLLPVVVPHVFDLERVEVLRGPQGTLYGAGSMGGTIRFIRPDPDLNSASYRLSAEGSVTERGDPSGEASAVADVPLVPGTLGFRGGVFYRSEGGWIDRADRNTDAVVDRDINGTDTLVASGELLLQASNSFSIAPSVFYQRTESKDMDFQWDNAPPLVTYTKRDQPTTDEFILASLTADLEVGRVSIKSITSYLDRDYFHIDDWTDSDGPVVANLILGIDESELTPGWVGLMYWNAKQKGFSQELRFSSNDPTSPFQWIAGLYYQSNKSHVIRHEYQDINAESIAVFGFPIDDPTIEGPLSSELGLPVTYFQDLYRLEKELAGFVNLTYQLTDQLSVSAGVRASRTTFRTEESTAGFWLGPPSTYQGRQKEKPISPKFDIRYQPDDDNTFYASVAKGFRIGGTNPDFSSTLCGVDLPPEGNPLEFGADSLWSYEVGSKNRFANRRGQISVSAYHIDWAGIQSIVVMPTCLNIYVDNLGKAKVDGVDMDFSFWLTDGLNAQVTAGYSNARYTETIERLGSTLVVEGQDFPIPKFNGSATLAYDGEIGRTPAFGSVTMSYAGKYKRNGPDGVSGADAAIRNAEPVTQLSARFGVELDNLTLTVFAENLANASPDLARTRLVGSMFGPPKIIERTLRPRTVGIGATLKF